MIKFLVCAIKQCTTIYQRIGISHQASVTVGLLGICITRTAFRELHVSTISQLHVSTISQISPKRAITKDTKGALCNIHYFNINSISTIKSTFFCIFIPVYFKQAAIFCDIFIVTLQIVSQFSRFKMMVVLPDKACRLHKHVAVD